MWQKGTVCLQNKLDSALNEKLNCKNDNREEALIYDNHSVGFLKKDQTLVGHTPIGLSQLFDYFMKEDKENFISALAVGSRKRKVGHNVLATFTAAIKEMRLVTILSAEILKIKTKCTHFELSFAESKTVKQPILYKNGCF